MIPSAHEEAPPDSDTLRRVRPSTLSHDALSGHAPEFGGQDALHFSTRARIGSDLPGVPDERVSEGVGAPLTTASLQDGARDGQSEEHKATPREGEGVYNGIGDLATHPEDSGTFPASTATHPCSFSSETVATIGSPELISTSIGCGNTIGRFKSFVPRAPNFVGPCTCGLWSHDPDHCFLRGKDTAHLHMDADTLPDHRDPLGLERPADQNAPLYCVFCGLCGHVPSACPGTSSTLKTGAGARPAPPPPSSLLTHTPPVSDVPPQPSADYLARQQLVGPFPFPLPRPNLNHPELAYLYAFSRRDNNAAGDDGSACPGGYSVNGAERGYGRGGGGGGSSSSPTSAPPHTGDDEGGRGELPDAEDGDARGPSPKKQRM